MVQGGFTSGRKLQEYDGTIKTAYHDIRNEHTENTLHVCFFLSRDDTQSIANDRMNTCFRSQSALGTLFVCFSSPTLCVRNEKVSLGAMNANRVSAVGFVFRGSLVDAMRIPTQVGDANKESTAGKLSARDLYP